MLVVVVVVFVFLEVVLTDSYISNCKAPRTRGVMMQGHVTATCCSHEIMCCSQIGDMFVWTQCDLVTTTCVPACVPVTCHLHVKKHDFVIALCHWDMSLHHDPLCARSLTVLSRYCWIRSCKENYIVTYLLTLLGDQNNSAALGAWFCITIKRTLG